MQESIKLTTFATANQKWQANAEKQETHGEVAELVDALLWGGSVNCDVGVRVSSSSLSFLGAALENAEIAQLVEHNLAKVGVAGPSPVFRSK